MKNADKTRSEQLSFVIFVEQTEDDAADGGEETAKERAIHEEKREQFFSNGKDTVPVLNIYDFEGHGSGSVDGVFYTTGGTESTMATKRRKFKVAADGAAKHGSTKRRVTTSRHPVNVLDDAWTRM